MDRWVLAQGQAARYVYQSETLDVSEPKVVMQSTP